VKNSFQAVKDKLVSRYLVSDDTIGEVKSTDINVLLNRVKLDQKKESRKKLLFLAAASSGVLIFGTLIF
jgi:hypothetical protein|tara:strand:- start:772 stop:978 length:207 start_codon:yes stop_codon:yes gene_type:complete